jgi:dihydroorotate dehydrogenase
VNVDGHHHPVIAYNPGLVSLIVAGVYARNQLSTAMAFKLSPYDASKEWESSIRDQIAFEMKGNTSLHHGSVELVLCNTLGGQEMFRPGGLPALGVTNNIGGKAGTALKGLTLDNVRYFKRSFMGLQVDIAASGGIRSGTDVLDCIQAGANKCQMTSEPYQYGFSVFTDIFQELAPFING